MQVTHSALEHYSKLQIRTSSFSHKQTTIVTNLIGALLALNVTICAWSRIYVIRSNTKFTFVIYKLFIYWYWQEQDFCFRAPENHKSWTELFDICYWPVYWLFPGAPHVVWPGLSLKSWCPCWEFATFVWCHHIFVSSVRSSSVENTNDMSLFNFMCWVNLRCCMTISLLSLCYAGKPPDQTSGHM